MRVLERVTAAARTPRTRNLGTNSLEQELPKKFVRMIPQLPTVSAVPEPVPAITTPPSYRKSIADSSHGLWDVPPPAQIVEVHNLDIGQVDTFIDDKGYGFMETADGRLFFHASGFRVPRVVPSRTKGLPVQEIQLAPIRARESREVRHDPEKVGTNKPPRIPIPNITAKLGLMFHAGERNGKRQALVWCLQDMYEALRSELTTRYAEELRTWQQLGRYRLDLCENRASGTHRADNQSKVFIPETKLCRTELFQGTNTEYLRDWFRSCRDTYQISTGNSGCAQAVGNRWIELFFQVFDSSTQSYSEWQLCDAATMHDFLGS